MTDSVQVAIGVIDGQVVAQWHEPVREIAFDPKNAYMIGMALCKAAMEAHRGHAAPGDLSFIADGLHEEKVTMTDTRRAFLVGQVQGIIKTFIEQHKSTWYIAQHCVDTVLADTAQ